MIVTAKGWAALLVLVILVAMLASGLWVLAAINVLTLVLLAAER